MPAVYLMSTCVLVTLMHVYAPIEKESQLLWRLERVRIVCSLESEFDKKKHGQYWVEGKLASPFLGMLFVLVSLCPFSVSRSAFQER